MPLARCRAHVAEPGLPVIAGLPGLRSRVSRRREAVAQSGRSGNPAGTERDRPGSPGRGRDRGSYVLAGGLGGHRAGSVPAGRGVPSWGRLGWSHEGRGLGPSVLTGQPQRSLDCFPIRRSWWVPPGGAVQSGALRGGGAEVTVSRDGAER